MGDTEPTQEQSTEQPAAKTGLFKRTLEKLNLTGKRAVWAIVTPAAVLFVVMSILGMIWSREPDHFNVRQKAIEKARRAGLPADRELMTGYVSTATLIRISNTLLAKGGGYLSNDKMPPSVLMDNMANWEFGVLVQVRDFSRVMRNDITRSQTQSVEDKDLAEAEPKFNFDNNSWLLPSSESQYKEGIAFLESYLARLSDENTGDGQFYARADNLREWLKIVEKRLGSLSQRLSASVGQHRLNTDLAGDPAARQARQASSQVSVKTPWLEIDDIFYEARGSAWALIHLLSAVQIDFGDVLERKNAAVSLQQIIRELEGTQRTVWSPMIMNGFEFGLFANHSLVMSSYISRANAAIIDLRSLLAQG